MGHWKRKFCQRNRLTQHPVYCYRNWEKNWLTLSVYVWKLLRDHLLYSCYHEPADNNEINGLPTAIGHISHCGQHFAGIFTHFISTNMKLKYLKKHAAGINGSHQSPNECVMVSNELLPVLFPAVDVVEHRAVWSRPFRVQPERIQEQCMYQLGCPFYQ